MSRGRELTKGVASPALLFTRPPYYYHYLGEKYLENAWGPAAFHGPRIGCANHQHQW